MAAMIRLTRGGAKKKPYYRIVVADKRFSRDGRFIEKLGTYNPLLAKDDAGRVTFNEERLKYWLGTGAQYSERLGFFFKQKNIDVDAIRKAGAKTAAAATAPKAEKPKAAKKPAAKKA